MICFFTSSPCVQGASELNPANGFVEELRAAVPASCRVLFVTAEPDDIPWTEMVAGFTKDSLEHAGFCLEEYWILERRTADRAGEWIASADLIILAGGHVPTENRFFADLDLRMRLKGYDGVIVGISAGTMNSAEIVYAQPEREGESVNPGYCRFLPGLGLTKTMILPHYQMVKDSWLDGQRLFKDITYGDSCGRSFYALVDGSYILSRNGVEELRGEAYLIRDGHLRRLSNEGERLLLSKIN